MDKAVRFLRIACAGTVLAIGIVAFSNTAQASQKAPELLDVVVCVDNATSVLKASVDRRCDRSSEFKVVWKARGSSPRVCVNAFNREMTMAQAGKCFQKNTRLAKPTSGNKILACASSSTRVLRWPMTGTCLTTNTPVRWFVAEAVTTPTTTTSIGVPNQPIITTSTSTTSLPPMLITTPVTSSTSSTSSSTTSSTSSSTTSSTSSTSTVAADTSSPTVTGVTSSTSNGWKKINANIVVLVAFNETVTVTGTPQITMETGVTDRVVNYYSGSGTSTLTFNYKVLASDTSSDLDYASTTALALNGGTIRDGSGNNAVLTLPAPGGANSISASKAIVIDTTTPTLVSTVPSDNAVGVAIDSNIVLNFSESVSNRMIGSKLYLKKLSDNSTVQEFSIPEFSGGGSQITVNPSSDLLAGTSYYVTLELGFGDSAGNFFPGFTDSTSLNFTTVVADTTAPTLTSTTPSDNATGVSDSTTVVLNFSEPVWGVVGKNVYVKKSSDDSIFETIPADGLDPTSNGIYGNGTTQITVRLSLTPTFSYNTEYYVQIDAGAFEDAAGNGFTGISSTTDLSFTIYNPTCTQKLAWGVDCLVGDIGPGGGEVFFTSGLGSSKYMEVGPTTWYDNTARQDFTWCAGKETQLVGVPGGSRGLGASNTARIASFCSPNGGAYWITQRNASGGIGGKTDWWLPTLSELNYLCLYARQLPENAGTCTNVNPLRAGFLTQSYWSSTEHNANLVWYQNFTNGGQAYFDGTKELRLVVRPVRSFG